MKILEEKEMKNCTGKPVINKKSKSIKRKVTDLLEWKETLTKKKEEEQKKKDEVEYQEIEKFKS